MMQWRLFSQKRVQSWSSKTTSIRWECQLWFIPTLSHSQNRLTHVNRVLTEASQKFTKSMNRHSREVSWQIFKTNLVYKNKRGGKCCWHLRGYAWEGKDHCHFSGQFRGAAHNKWNLLFRKPKHVPVIFHNLSGYDSHLFIKNLGKTQGQIDCIPNNEEKHTGWPKKMRTHILFDKKPIF